MCECDRTHVYVSAQAKESVSRCNLWKQLKLHANGSASHTDIRCRASRLLFSQIPTYLFSCLKSIISLNIVGLKLLYTWPKQVVFCLNLDANKFNRIQCNVFPAASWLNVLQHPTNSYTTLLLNMLYIKLLHNVTLDLNTRKGAHCRQ